MIDKPIDEKKEFFSNIQKLLSHTKNKCIIIGNIWSEFEKQNTNNQIIFKTGLEQIIPKKESKLNVI